MHKTLNCRCFQSLLFRYYTRKEYLAQIIKNKNLPFVKTKTGMYCMYRSKTAERNLLMRNKLYL